MSKFSKLLIIFVLNTILLPSTLGSNKKFGFLSLCVGVDASLGFGNPTLFPYMTIDSIEEMPFTGEKDLYYYTYRIDCLISETPYYYLGKHATKNLEDGYRGSGPGLLSLYKNFNENLCFKMTIIKFYLNEEEVLKGEKVLVGSLYKVDLWCLNRVPGGDSRSVKHSQKTKDYLRALNKGMNTGLDNAMNKPGVREKQLEACRTEEHKKKLSEASKKNWENPEYRTKVISGNIGKVGPMTGKFHSIESKEKMSKSTKGICKSEEVKKKMIEAWKKRKEKYGLV